MAAQLGETALDERVLSEMAKVPRHESVPVEVQPYAAETTGLPTSKSPSATATPVGPSRPRWTK